MELDNARAAVTAYGDLIAKLVAALQNQATGATGVDPSAVQALADQMNQFNAAFQAAIATIAQKS